MWLGIDIGTGGSRALLVDERGAVRGAVRGASMAHHEDMQMERLLWAEQRPENWWDAAVIAIRGTLAVAGVDGSQVTGIGLSGQMHGLVILDGAGEVIRPSLIWCDQRSQAQVDAVNVRLGRENILRLIANPVLTGFTLPKLLWVRDHEPQHFARVRRVLLPKDYVRFRLTGEFATDVSDASGTELFDVVNRRWSFEMVDGLGLDRKLPDAAFPYIIDPDFTTGATPSCQSNGSNWYIANGVLTYTMDFQMGWYADGSWYACEGTIYNPGSATADITYTAPETYVVPNMTGPLSANTGIPATLNIPGGQQYSSWGKPEFFVFYYGDGSSSGYVYTNTTHTYAAPGTYQMTFNVYTTNGPYVPAANAWTVTVTTLPVSITLATGPPGLTITADGTGYTAPHLFSWTPGSQHTIAVTSPQGSSGTQYVFSSWTDAGAASHTITVPMSAATYAANFVTQYYLTTTPGAGGSITPASGWQNAGNVQITAAPSDGYALSAFGGALSGTTNPQTLNLTGPATVTASFLAVPTSAIYTSPPGLQISVDGGGAVSCNPCDYQWLTNSWHSVSAALQSGGAGVQYAFLNWSDGLAATHSFEVPTQGTNLTATFQPQYYLTTSVSPAGSGAIMVGAPTQWGPVVATGTQAAGWYNAGSPFWIIAQASAGYQFSSLSPVDNLWEQIALHQPMTVTATFVPFYGQTVTSNPPGASITVDGASCTTPCTYQWSTGTQHTLGVASPQYPASGTQLIFSSWTDDSSGSSDTIMAAAGAVYVANFGTQYYLTTSAVPPAGGSISPGSGWYNTGQVVQVSATANVGYPFTGFSGGLTGTTNPQNVTMNTPVTVTADFGATAAISSSPSTLSFTVDGSACAGGVCPFTPQPSGDTLAASPVSPPTSGPSASYQFTGSGLTPQMIPVPPPGADGDGCTKWKCTGGSCTVNTPTGSPQPAPIIQPPPGGTYAISSDPAGLSPAVIYAGLPTTIYIHGTNFGDVAGWVTLCGAQGGACDYSEAQSYSQGCPGTTNPDWQCSWSNSRIMVTVEIDPNDPQADKGLWWIYLNVPFWIAGSDFENPSTGSFEMEPAPTPTLVVTSNGNQINSGDTIYVDPTPQIPPITATLTLPGGQTVPGNAAYQLVVTFNQIVDKQGDTQQDTWAYPYGPVQQPGPPASQPQTWNIPPEGNQATINWWYNGAAQTPFNFSILGQNPGSAAALAQLGQSAFWMLPNIALHETNLAQFCQPGVTDGSLYCSGGQNPGMPIYGQPGGYGMVQLDPPPSAAAIWDWIANVAGGNALLQSLAGPASYSPTLLSAYPFWLRQVQQWQTYNQAHPNDQVPAPANRQEGAFCTFALGTSPTTSSPYWFGDAVLIKQYGGTVLSNGQNINYIAWDSSTNPNGWTITPQNKVNPDVVLDVCNCTTRSTCTHNGN